ncbi:MAG: sulfotransferase [Saprospiraceae bacterium]|nr:sulfotransferase [Saprospiraceae bacterium]
MILPNLLVIGAMKAGTTSLHAYLDQHPDIFMSEEKELDFFVEKKYLEKGIDWYKSQFPGPATIRGESSQNYTKRHHPDYTGIPERIKQIIPDVKLIYIVRDPVERYRSHYVENFYGDSPERIAFNKSIQHPEKTSLYFYQLSAFLEHFNADQILVVCLEELHQKRLEEMNRIFRFLGVSELSDESVFNFVSNTSESKTIPIRVKKQLWYRVLHRLMPNFLDRFLLIDRVRNRVFPGGKKLELSEKELERLQALFAPDVAQLRSFTNKSFGAWKL